MTSRTVAAACAIRRGPATAANVVVGDLVPTQVTVTGVRSNEFTCTVACTRR
jgi:hypothetical protein